MATPPRSYVFNNASDSCNAVDLHIGDYAYVNVGTGTQQMKLVKKLKFVPPEKPWFYKYFILTFQRDDNSLVEITTMDALPEFDDAIVYPTF